jgi:hypothetical protein
MREAPSIALITALLDMGATVRAYESLGIEQAKKILTASARTKACLDQADNQWLTDCEEYSCGNAKMTRSDGASASCISARYPVSHRPHATVPAALLGGR